MDVTLPSGNTVTFRDKAMRDDLIEFRRAMRFVTAPDGSRPMDGAFMDAVRTAIYRRMLVSWSFGPQVPHSCATADLADRLLAQYLDEDDAVALDMVIQPWVDKIITDPTVVGRATIVHAATGLRLRADSPEAAQQLIATGDFAAAAAGPKAMPTLTATTSVASLEPGGQTPTE